MTLCAQPLTEAVCLTRCAQEECASQGLEVDWQETLKWTLRKGSTIYSGEWEWI